mmetsp:Transcript_156977/g.273306  ORF Transcript_156977/g.273306 Transcript_156977/m.273306 type:complete len:215 (-) Transcript_156977:143-787(-)
MRNSVLVLACLAFAGHAHGQEQAETFGERQSSEALTALLMAFSPASAFMPSSLGAVRPAPGTALAPRLQLHPRTARSQRSRSSGVTAFFGGGGGGGNQDGVTVTTIKEGDGKTYPKPGQKVKCHYTGKLEDGTEFDTSRKLLGGFAGIGAFEFTIGYAEVIQGWDKGIAQMSKGEVATLDVSPGFGYGAQGAPPVIPPNARLIFEVELLDVSDA